MDQIKLKEIQFGKTSSEGEQSIDSGQFLLGVREELVSLEKLLKDKKFIVLGRKGSGKSYLKEYSYLDRKYDIFVDLLSFKDLEYEKFSRANTGINLNNTHLWEFVFLCKFLKLALQTQKLNPRSSDFASKLWVHISSYLNPDTMMTTKIITEHSGEIKTSFFKNLFSSILRDKVIIEKEKQTYAQMVLHIKQFLLEILQGSINEVNYVLFLDEVDENYRGTDVDKSSVAEVVKVARSLFEEFQRSGINFFPVVLLRNDIFEQIGDKLDVRKIKDDYLVEINWYDEVTARTGTEATHLRSFLEKRLKYSYEKKYGKLKKIDYWEFQFKTSEDNGDQLFKYIADRTLYRPRDFISLLLKIQSKYGESKSISRDMVEHCMREYSESLVEEFKFELSIHFDRNVVDVIINKLCSLPPSPLEKEEVTFRFSSDDGITDQDILSVLYGYGIIGIVDQNQKYYWKYRSKDIEFEDFDFSRCRILKHNALSSYKRSKFKLLQR